MTWGFIGRRWLILCLAVGAALCLVAPAAASADAPLTVVIPQLVATEGQSFTGVVATFFDSVADDQASDYSATIEWGDGTSTTGTVAGTADTTGPWTVTGSHDYAEEGVYGITVTVTDTPGSTSGVAQGSITVGDAPLALPTGGSPTLISGTGSSAAGALNSFEGAIGGSDNGTTPGEQNGGFRHITWDTIALDGSDPASTTIIPGHVVSIAPNRTQPWGIDLGRGVAVANNGFASVNSSVGGKFTPFSSPNVFAPYNSNRISMSIVAPAAQASGTNSAATRGLGVMFLNTWQPGPEPGESDTSIQFYSGTALLETAYAPLAEVGQASFVGVLFPSPAVTSVVLTLGTAQIFSFDGTSITSGPADTPPSGPPAGNNLVAGDDVVLAEPTSAVTTIQATVGVPVSGLVDSFSDTDPGGVASDFTAVVSWGDGSLTGAPVSAAAGGFSVTGTHTYTRSGSFPVVTTVTDFGGSTQSNRVTIVVAPRASTTGVSCSPSPVAMANATVCTATVSDVGGGTSITPTGSVAFTSATAGASFSSDSGCVLVATKVTGESSCSVSFTPTQFPPRRAKIVANYTGDGAHSASTGTGFVKVRAQRCTIKLVSKRVSQHATRLPVTVTCDMHADIRVTIVAVLSSKTRVTFAFLKTTVAANKPTRLRIAISRSGLKALRNETKSQHFSLKMTVIATPRSRPLKTSVTVKGVKVS